MSERITGRDKWDTAMGVLSILALHLVGIAAGHGAILFILIYFIGFSEPIYFIFLLPMIPIGWLLTRNLRGDHPRRSRTLILLGHALGTALCVGAYIGSAPTGKWLPLYSSIPWLAVSSLRFTIWYVQSYIRDIRAGR